MGISYIYYYKVVAIINSDIYNATQSTSSLKPSRWVD